MRNSEIKKNVETLSADTGCSRENLDIKNIKKKVQRCCKDTFKKEIKKRIDLEDKISEKRSNRNIMDLRLLTQNWCNIYKKRSYTIEPIFGQIKDGFNLNRFLFLKEV